MTDKYVRLSLRITDDEKQKLDAYAEASGLSRSAIIRQLCLGTTPKPKPPNDFWLLLEALYRVHNALYVCAEYHPPALEACAELEQFTLRLQAAVTAPEVM